MASLERNLGFLLLSVLLLYSVSTNGQNIADNWVVGPAMPTSRSSTASTVYKDVIYVFGGLSNRTFGALDIVERFNVTSGSWDSGFTSLPMPLHSASATTYLNNIYIVGGFSVGLKPVNNCWKYDPEQNTWKSLSPLNLPRGGLASEWVRDRLYVIGGYDGTTVTAVNEMYNPNTNEWDFRSPMPTARQNLACAAVDGVLYAIGGRTPSNVNINEAYDPLDNQWSSRPSMPTPRSDIQAAVFQGRIFTIGGEGLTVFGENEEYLPEENLWKCRAPMPTPRHGYAVGVVDNRVIVLGGSTGVLLASTGTTEEYQPPDADTAGLCQPPVESPAMILSASSLWTTIAALLAMGMIAKI